MNRKNITKIIIDISMLILMLLEYSKLYTGQLVHEVVGIILFVLFLIHNLLNISFYKNLLKGKYNISRSFMTVINILFLFCMIFTIMLGIPISEKVFRFLNLNGNMTIRMLHTILGYWNLILLAIHLGLHFRMIFSKLINKIKDNKLLKILLYIIQLIIVIYGIKTMFDTNLGLYLTGNASFAIPSNIYLSLFNNLSIILAISVIIFQLQKILLKKEKNRKENKI